MTAPFTREKHAASAPLTLLEGSPAPAFDPKTEGARTLPYVWRRRLGIGITISIVVAALLPVGLWLGYQSANVVSRNAMVRSHLSEVGARLEGVVVSMAVEAGDSVVAGQELARLDSRHLVAREHEALAEIAALERELEVSRATLTYERDRVASLVTEARAAVSARRAELVATRARAEDAAAYFEARRKLQENGAVANETARGAESRMRETAALVDAAQADLTAAVAYQARAELEHQSIRLGERRLGVLEARLDRARAALAAVRADIDSSVIRAPAAGAVVRRIAQPGTSMDVGQPIVSLWLGNDAWVEAWIPEAELGGVGVGANATVTLHAFPDQEFRGVVQKVGLATDYEMPADYVPQPRATRMRQAPVIGVAIRLSDPPPAMRPGMSAVVAIERSPQIGPGAADDRRQIRRAFVTGGIRG